MPSSKLEDDLRSEYDFRSLQVVARGAGRKESGEVWDQQFEADVKAGKLDSLAELALRAHAEGKSTKL